MTMYFPTNVVTGPGAAYVFLLYALQLVWTILAAAFFLVVDRSAVTMLASSPTLGNAASELEESNAPKAASPASKG
jgi:hypothetical protein